MGIDVYLRWDDQTSEESSAQITGFSPEHGHVGYLREAYHGPPYATEVLVPEAFDVRDARIPAATLRGRLEATCEAALERERKVYRKEDASLDDPVVRSFVAFVELAERLEAEGRNPRVYVSY